MCYDLNRMANERILIPGTISVIDSISIKPDTGFLRIAYPRYQHYLALRKKLLAHQINNKDLKLMVSLNPHYYDAYEQAGDHYNYDKQYSQALEYYKNALSCVISGEKEYNRIKKKMFKLSNKITKEY